MDPTISVSKGCFVFKNGATNSRNRNKKSKKKMEYVPLLDKSITNQPFYTAYSKLWKNIESEIYNYQKMSSTKAMEDLANFVSDAYQNNIDYVLPAAALMTGINQPDHYRQFENLCQRITESTVANVCIIQARDCSSVKCAIETLVSNLIEEEVDEEDRSFKRLRKSQYTMQVLESWYTCEYPRRDKTLVIIMPDFECFEANVLQDFILILSSYCHKLPIVLILGVATAVSTLHSTLPYHVTSKIRLQIFQMQSAPSLLNEIIDNVILSPECPFHLSGKTFKFLIDIFLFYDFSINGFIQGFKYCMMEHYFQGNAFSLCNNYTESLSIIENLKHNEVEAIRHLLSFRPYVEAMQNRNKIISTLNDDAYFKDNIPELLKKCHKFFIMFRCLVEFLTQLIDDLPKSPLGKHKREIYATCSSSSVVELPEFKECWQILSFLSKDEFMSRISKAVNCTTNFMRAKLNNDKLSTDCMEVLLNKFEQVNQLLTRVWLAGTHTSRESSSKQTDLTQLTREELKEQLIKMSKQSKPVSDFTKSLTDTLDYIKDELISKYLLPFSTHAPPLYELFVFSDISNIRHNIVGTPRAALHTALNNPQFYLQCSCCELDEETSLVPTMPDLTVSYKLHRECGRMINLFDWLQAFRAVVDFNEDEQEQIDPKIQARFTRTVAELQLLGYIRTSKQKTDHVTRLTW